MSLMEDFKTAGIHIRPEVQKMYTYFLGCVKHHGSDAVRTVLLKGSSGKFRLKIMKNKKDRYQMMQVLDLIKEKPHD